MQTDDPLSFTSHTLTANGLDVQCVLRPDLCSLIPTSQGEFPTVELDWRFGASQVC